MKKASCVVLYAVTIVVLGEVAFSQALSRAGEGRSMDTGVEVTVFDPIRARIPGTKISVVKNQATIAYSVTDQSGECQLELSPETYELFAQVAGFEDGRQIVKVREHEITQIQLTMAVAPTSLYDPIDGVHTEVPASTLDLNGKILERESNPIPASESSRKELLELENRWLAAEHDPKALESILAPDFLHVVKKGIITREQQLEFVRKHPAPDARESKHLEDVHVRIYGTVGIVNGVVVATGSGQTRRTLFTDVFAYRDDNWQAVSAQELPEEKH